MMNEFKRVGELVSLESYAESKLRKAHGKFVCPFCGSGGHDSANSDSAFCINPRNKRKFRCFSCGANGDVFDLCAQVEGIDPGNKIAQINAVKQWLGETPKASSNRNPSSLPPNTPKAPSGTAEGKRRALGYIRACQSHIAECASYLEERGIPLTFAMDHGIGYDPRKSMLIIPYPDTSYYIGRSTAPNARIRHLKPKSYDVGPEPIFNEKTLEADYVIVTEGAIDCLSVEKLGLNAVAIGGASNWQRLASLLKERESKPAVLILFDRDTTGITSSRAFANSLAKAGIRSSIPSPPKQLKGKDPNDWLRADERMLASFLKSEIKSLLGGCHEV